MSSMTSSDVYHDVQYPRTPIVLGALGVVGMAIAVGAVFGTVSTLLTSAVGGVLLAITSFRARLDIDIAAEGVRVGPAAIGWEWIERVEVLEGARMRAALTTDGHPLDHIDIRRSAAGLRLWLADPSDPHRCWVTSITHPDQLRTVLERIGGVAHAS